MTIPNYFTLIRLAIAPLFLIFYCEHDGLGVDDKALPFLLLILVALMEVSDAVDGFLARKLCQVSDLGKILDPMADSLSRLTVFLAFTSSPVNLPLLVVFLFFFRDSLVSTLRTICALKGFTLAARQSGKIKAVIQAIAIFSILFIMIPQAYGVVSQETLHNYSTGVALAAALYSLLSAVEYFYANRFYLKQVISA